MLFEALLPDGTAIEGATIISVDENTKLARFFLGTLWVLLQCAQGNGSLTRAWD